VSAPSATSWVTVMRGDVMEAFPYRVTVRLPSLVSKALILVWTGPLWLMKESSDTSIEAVFPPL
jgi:hypothetical protein